MKTYSRYLCCLIVTILLLQTAFGRTAAAATQTKPLGRIHLENLLPVNTLFYCRTFDLSSLDKAVDKTSIGKLKNHPEISEFIDMLTIKKEEFIDRLVKERSVDRPMVGRILNGQYSIAFHGIDPATGSPLIYLAVSFPDKPDREKLFNALKGLAWVNLSSHIPAQEIKMSGTTVLNLPMPGVNSTFFKENNYFALLSNLLVMTTSKEGLKLLIDNYNNHSMAKTLAGDELFSKVYKNSHTSKNGSFVFLNTRVAVPIIKFMSSPETGKLIDAIGLPAVDAFGFSINFPGEGMRHTLYLHSPRERTGILKVLKPAGGIEKISSIVPVQTSDLFSAKVDLSALYEEFPRLLDSLSLARGFDLKNAFGLNMLADKNDALFGVKAETIIKTLGSYVTIHSGPAGAVIRFENADTENFEKIISFMEKKMQNSFTSISEGEKIIRYFNQSGKPVPFAPTYSISGKNEILVATHPQVLKAFFRQEVKYLLRQSKDYQLAVSGLPAEMGLLYYVHSTRSYSRVYDAMLPFMNAITAYSSISADPGILPPGKEIEKYFFGFAVSANSNAEGITITAHSPLGIGGTLVYGADKLVANNPAVMSVFSAWLYKVLGYTEKEKIPQGANAGNTAK
ncbi:MAG: hypothetical protein ACYTFY_07640 [Planctomycetota bacterium]|jgi:hypothetical protein